MGIALTVPLFFDSVPGMLWYAALMGVGYGAFMSVDMALMTQVLPQSLRRQQRIHRQGPGHSHQRGECAADPEPGAVRLSVEPARQRLPMAVRLGDGVRVRRSVFRAAHQIGQVSAVRGWIERGEECDVEAC